MNCSRVAPRTRPARQASSRPSGSGTALGLYSLTAIESRTRHDGSVWILASPARPEGFSELAPTFCEKLCNGGMRIHTTWLKFWRSILRFREARQFSVKVDHSDLNWTVVACQNAARSISVMQFDEFHSEQPETGNESAGSSLILSHSFGKDVVCSAREGALH
jgi:hypothetical protein